MIPTRRGPHWLWERERERPRQIPPRPQPPRPVKRLIEPLPRPLKQRYDWDTDMTLCIAALAQDRGFPRIVLCFDSKVAAEGFGSETEYKFHRLSGQLCSMFAGSPGRAKELAGIYREFLDANLLDKGKVIDQLREPVTLFKRRLASAYIGRTLGLTYEDLLSNGVKWLGAEHQRHLQNIEGQGLGVDLIIAGFIEEFPVLCQMERGEVEWKTGFSLIGTGVYTAEPALHARKQTDQTPLLATLYNVYEAKRIGESSPFVGKHTAIFILQPADEPSSPIGLSVVTPEGFGYLGGLFEEYGPKPWPALGRYDLPKDALIRTQ